MNTNAMELLLNSNIEAIKKPTKMVEIERLSEAFGATFEVEVQAIDLNQFTAVMKNSKEFEDDTQLSSIEASVLAVKEGMISPKLTDKELQKHLGASNWKELLNKLFLTGEIMNISEEIMNLSQLSSEDKKKIKKK